MPQILSYDANSATLTLDLSVISSRFAEAREKALKRLGAVLLFIGSVLVITLAVSACGVEWLLKTLKRSLRPRWSWLMGAQMVVAVAWIAVWGRYGWLALQAGEWFVVAMSALSVGAAAYLLLWSSVGEWIDEMKGKEESC